MRYAAAEPVKGERAVSWREVVESASVLSQGEFLKCMADFGLMPVRLQQWAAVLVLTRPFRPPQDYLTRLQAVEIYCLTAATWMSRYVARKGDGVAAECALKQVGFPPYAALPTH